MKATELRIGNLVEETHSGEFGKVDMVVLSIIERMSNHSYIPIPLTEEWLTRFGFENYSIDCDLEGFNHIDVSFHNKLVTVYLNDYEIAFIQHVHQLQNLYHALTGQELQTDETKQKVNQ